MKKIVLFSLLLVSCNEDVSINNDKANMAIIKKQDSTILLLEDALDLCEEENQILGSALAEKNGN